MNLADDPRLQAIAASHSRPLLFATISGSHLYGFSSADSDVDLRGVHVLSVRELVGLRRGPDTIERMDDQAGFELDLVTHDAGKFVRLLLKPNGYVLEQLLSPLVVFTTAAHGELSTLGRRCVTRRHAGHYLGFAQNQWRLFTDEPTPRVKPLLYTYRTLLTGVHLMRTGEIEADLSRLNAEARLAIVDELILQKTTGAEKCTLATADLDLHAAEYERLRQLLLEAAAASVLPDAVDAATVAALDEWLVRVRLAT